MSRQRVSAVLTDNIHFGQRLRELRLRRNLRLIDCAMALNYSTPSGYRALELREVAPDGNVLRDLSDFFGVDPRYFLGDDECMTKFVISAHVNDNAILTKEIFMPTMRDAYLAAIEMLEEEGLEGGERLTIGIEVAP